MITKDSLNKAKDSVNLASLKLKQSYSNSPSSRKIYFIIEGKDDITFYGTKSDEYLPDGWELRIIPAGNRKKAIDVYYDVDWTIYNKEKIMFFIDKDLSDYTGEETPSDTNIYVTSKYAIENELCTYATFIKALKYYYGLNDITESDEQLIESLYSSWWTTFSELCEPIMAQILHWKSNHIHSSYSNFKIQNIFEIKDNQLQCKNAYISNENILKELHQQSGIAYNATDTSAYRALLNSKHTHDEYIRGKYVVVFFVKAIHYISKNSTTILPSKLPSHSSISLGYEDAVSKLCGIMRTPSSLRDFFENMNHNLLQMTS